MSSSVIQCTKKGYKIYNIETQEVSITKDVTFYEQFLPFQYIKSISNKDKLHSIFLPVNNIDNPSQDWEAFPYSVEQDIDLTSITHEPQEETEEEEEQAENTAEESCSTEQMHPPITDNIRRSQRICRQPAHITDYYCNTSQHWCGIVESKIKSKYSQKHNQNMYPEPKSYKSAIKDPA